ncbi:unknown [Bacteroides eggerthii CAG:109]|nr:unknown [Bacteroides eggerthii CAG:109]
MKELRFVAYAYWKSYADRGLSALLQILLIVYPIDFVFCN